MPATVLITDATGTGYAYLVRIPYKNRSFITTFKEAVPEPGRDWHPRLAAWLFRRNYLSVVRQIVARYAETEGWQVLDTVAMMKDQARLSLQVLDHQEHEDHVSRFLEVFPRLPANALMLAGWLEHVLIFDVDAYLGEELFYAWIEASLPDRKYPSLPYVPKEKSKMARIVASTDPRIIQAMLSHPIQRLRVVSGLTPVAIFDDGIIHWRDEQGSLWFGAPYQLALKQQERVRALYQPGQTYHVAFSPNEQVHLIAQAESLTDRFFAWGLNPSIGFMEGYKSPPTNFPVSAFLERYHLVDWFVTWTRQCLAKQECLPVERYEWHRSLWENRNYWIHPAQGLISLLLYHSEEEMQALLGWSDDYVKELHARIMRIKEYHARAYLEYCRAHAVELALPKLETKSKGELLALGEQYGIEARKSWTNQRLAQTLLSSGEPSVKLAKALLEIPEPLEAMA